MQTVRPDKDIVRLERMNGTGTYRWVGDQSRWRGQGLFDYSELLVPHEDYRGGHNIQYRVFSRTGKWDFLGYPIYQQIP